MTGGLVDLAVEVRLADELRLHVEAGAFHRVHHFHRVGKGTERVLGAVDDDHLARRAELLHRREMRRMPDEPQRLLVG